MGIAMEHPYEQYLSSRTTLRDWRTDYPDDGSEANTMFRKAITMAAHADDFPVTEPYEVAGLRIDGWVELKNGYEFAFRLDKDLPYVVRFTREVGPVFDWRIEHWEV